MSQKYSGHNVFLDFNIAYKLNQFLHKKTRKQLWRILVQWLSHTKPFVNNKFCYNPNLNDLSVSEDFAAKSGLFCRVIGVLGVRCGLQEKPHVTLTDLINLNAEKCPAELRFKTKQFYVLWHATLLIKIVNYWFQVQPKLHILSNGQRKQKPQLAEFFSAPGKK